MEQNCWLFYSVVLQSEKLQHETFFEESLNAAVAEIKKNPNMFKGRKSFEPISTLFSNE